ncbi:hypothetical protein WJX74_007839 [Apatococcus lobatus]|uniref:Uncharacterized protein n=1 Tax=Apatococcus lobatus TaxID=904363 RepID=A0AAW1R2T7_9CHLO
MSPLSFSKRGDVNTLDVHQPQGARLRLLVRTLEDSASHARESPVSTVLAVVLRDGKTLMALKSNAGVVRGWLVAVKGRALQEMDAVVSHFRRLMADDRVAFSNASVTVELGCPAPLTAPLCELLLIDHVLPPNIRERIICTCNSARTAQVPQDPANEDNQKKPLHEAGGDGSASEDANTPPMYGPKVKGRWESPRSFGSTEPSAMGSTPDSGGDRGPLHSQGRISEDASTPPLNEPGLKAKESLESGGIFASTELGASGSTPERDLKAVSVSFEPPYACSLRLPLPSPAGALFP